jgi:hypothetical protein
MDVCICICIYAHLRTSICIYMHIFICLYIYIDMYVMYTQFNVQFVSGPHAPLSTCLRLHMETGFTLYLYNCNVIIWVVLFLYNNIDLYVVYTCTYKHVYIHIY